LLLKLAVVAVEPQVLDRMLSMALIRVVMVVEVAVVRDILLL
tara:strand:- start:81 stop:206 length:126 start_codon:yes stop_codon:yes gene_type:complete